jgi:hypothetical protein
LFIAYEFGRYSKEIVIIIDIMCHDAHAIEDQMQLAWAVAGCIEITGLQIGTSILVQNTKTRTHQPCVPILPECLLGRPAIVACGDRVTEQVTNLMCKF